MASGSTHKNGTTATCWQIWLVVASSMTEGTVASAIHRMRVARAGAGTTVAIDSSASAGGSLLMPRAHSATPAANKTKSIDHEIDCALKLSAGSTRNG